jgi:hypothetical protein
MDFSEITVTTELVTAVIGGLGLLIELFVLLAPSPETRSGSGSPGSVSDALAGATLRRPRPQSSRAVDVRRMMDDASCRPKG